MTAEIVAGYRISFQERTFTQTFAKCLNFKDV